jgi:hypothetical protein
LVAQAVPPSDLRLHSEVVFGFELQVESNPKYQNGQDMREHQHDEFRVKGLIMGEIKTRNKWLWNSKNRGIYKESFRRKSYRA